MTEVTVELLEKFGQAQEALIIRQDTKIDNLEQMIAALTTGYAELTAMVEALVEERMNSEDAEAFIQLLVAKKRKILEALNLGHINAENSSETFNPTYQ